MGYRSGVAVSCDEGRRCGVDPALLWRWCRPAAAAPIQPLAWEPPNASGAAVKRQKKKKKKSLLDAVTWERPEGQKFGLEGGGVSGSTGSVASREPWDVGSIPHQVRLCRAEGWELRKM